MSVYVILGGEPTFTNGQLNAGGGVVLDRVTNLDVVVETRPEVSGTLVRAMRVTINRDASQGTAADMAGWKAQFAGGRAGKKPQKLTVMLVDDVSGTIPLLIGKFESEEALVIAGGLDDDDSPTQTWAFTCNGYQYFNAISGKYEPDDKNVSPARVHGFSETAKK